MKTIRIAAALAGFTALPGAAFAQVVLAGQGVADRARPDYDAIGTDVGGFRLYPAVTTSLEATDNYLASNTGRRSDVWVSIRPELGLRSQWARHRLDVSLFADQAIHGNLTSENATQFGGTLGGVYDISRETQLRGDFAAGRYVESRSSLGSVQGTIKPVEFTVLHAGLGLAQQLGDLTLNANSSLDYRNFSDTLLPGNVVFDQDFRDVRSTSVGGSAQYALRNGIGLIASLRYSDDRYTFRPGAPGFVNGVDVNRNSSGFNAQGGVTLELSKLVIGTIQVGYLDRRYSDPRLRNFSGLSFDANLLWNVTPLTTLRFQASRSVQDTSSPVVAGNIRSDFHFYVDHELYRNIILSGDGGYGSFRPNGIGFGGDEYTVGAGVRYLIDRRFSVNAGARYSGRSSDSSFLRYNAASGFVSVRVQF